ncbi:MAG: hypothetical protein ACQGVK_20155 [Myxococcota bacterium]
MTAATNDTRTQTGPWGGGARLLDFGLRGRETAGPCDGAHILEAADALLERADGPGMLASLEDVLASGRDRWPLEAQLAVKLARSRQILLRETRPGHVSIVVPLYGEHRRMLHPEEDPVGEDFIGRKLAQLDWLFRDAPGLGYDLLLVDDGCPHASGRLAEERLARLHPGAPARVLFLRDAIAEHLPVAAGLRDVDDSRKGGAVEYGMWTAAQEPRPRHVIAYTDADLSTHLGQLGLLLEPVWRRGLDVAVGSRRERCSFSVKSGARSDRGLMFIYLWKRLLPDLRYLLDTQCGFKAFRADRVPTLVSGSLEKGFAFDIELLLRAERTRTHSIEPVPIAWIDSESASTTTQLRPYLGMLKSVVRLYRAYLSADPDAERFARAIESLDEARWDRLVGNVPAELSGADPARFPGLFPQCDGKILSALH